MAMRYDLKNTSASCLKLFSAFLIMAVMTGCASIVGYSRMYPGTPEPLSRIAILTHPNPYSQTVMIFKIDGQKAFLPGLAELTPGKHTVTTSFATSKGSTITRSQGLTDIEFSAEAGHVYTIYPVVQTHTPHWQPAVWDITNELSAPQHVGLIEKLDAILLKNRGMVSESVATLAPGSPPVELKGFGEQMTSNLKPWTGKDLPVSYDFYRYKPYITVNAPDKAEYHLEIDPRTGRIVNVFGRTVDVGGAMAIIKAFQPTGSALAYQIRVPEDDTEEKILRSYEEQADGSFTLIEDRWWSRIGNNHYSALLPMSVIDGLSKDAIRALVLAVNTDPDILSANKQVRDQVTQLSREDAAYILEFKAIAVGKEALRRMEAAVAEAGDKDQAVMEKAMAVCKRTVQSNLFGNGPVPNYHSVKAQFFSTGFSIAPKNQRKYQTVFSQHEATYIGWELDLELPAPGRRLDYQIKAHWFKPDGSLLTHQTESSYCEATWTTTWHAGSKGYDKPGSWQPGTYHVDFYIGGNKVAEKDFTIQ